MGPLRRLRLNRAALVALACLSGVMTTVVINAAGDPSAAQLAAEAALHEQALTLPAHSSGAGTTSASDSSSAPSGGDSGGAHGHASASSTSASTASDSSSGSTAAGAGDGSATSDHAHSPAKRAPDAGLPKVGHVFEIILSTSSYGAAWGKGSQAPYLRSLVRRGTLLSGFSSFGGSELADYLAMVSGQAPNADTSAGCTTYRDYPLDAHVSAQGIVAGSGCVYPSAALTLGDQITGAGKQWDAYIAGMGATACQVPAIGGPLDAPLTGTQPGYDLLHNPFAFFHSLLDEVGCANSDLDLSALPKALSRASATPALSFIAPDACADAALPSAAATPGTTTSPGATTTPGTATTPDTSTTSGAATTSAVATTPEATTAPAASTTTTTTGTTPAQDTGVCPAGEATGIAAEDAFLKTWVPKILAAPAYHQDGVLVIAFAATGHRSSTTASVPAGALVISSHTRRGKRLKTGYGPYSLLRSLEDMLDLSPLAHAASAKSFAAAVL